MTSQIRMLSDGRHQPTVGAAVFTDVFAGLGRAPGASSASGSRSCPTIGRIVSASSSASHVAAVFS